MRSGLDDAVRRGISVIPVLLPGLVATPELPKFLHRFTWVDFREGFTNEAIERLVWGIRSDRN
jgi:hypothetical protein